MIQGEFISTALKLPRQGQYCNIAILQYCNIANTLRPKQIFWTSQRRPTIPTPGRGGVEDIDHDPRDQEEDC